MQDLGWHGLGERAEGREDRDLRVFRKHLRVLALKGKHFQKEVKDCMVKVDLN